MTLTEKLISLLPEEKYSNPETLICGNRHYNQALSDMKSIFKQKSDEIEKFITERSKGGK